MMPTSEGDRPLPPFPPPRRSLPLVSHPLSFSSLAGEPLHSWYLLVAHGVRNMFLV